MWLPLRFHVSNNKQLIKREQFPREGHMSSNYKILRSKQEKAIKSLIPNDQSLSPLPVKKKRNPQTKGSLKY